MGWLKDFVNNFFGLLYDGFVWIIDSIITVIGYALFLIYDGILTVIFAFASAVDLSAVMFNIAAEYSNLPPQLIWIINAICLPQMLTYITSGIIVRMVINLIPAAVTRV